MSSFHLLPSLPSTILHPSTNREISVTDHVHLPSEQMRTSLAWTVTRLVSSIAATRARGGLPEAGSMWMLAHYVNSVIVSSQCNVSTLLVTLVYLNRAKSHLDPESFGTTRTRERIFMAAIVLATKYTEDYPPKNRSWARVARVFTARDIGNAELQLLYALGWDLSVTECNVMEQVDDVSTVVGYYRM